MGIQTTQKTQIRQEYTKNLSQSDFLGRDYTTGSCLKGTFFFICRGKNRANKQEGISYVINLEPWVQKVTMRHDINDQKWRRVSVD